MTFVVYLCISMLSFAIGLAAVVVVFHRQGMLKPAMLVLQNQQLTQAEINALELKISDRDSEIIRLKKQLKDAKRQINQIEASPVAQPQFFELDENEPEVIADFLEQPVEPKPVAQTSVLATAEVEEEVTKEKDVASLEDMNLRLKQIGLITNSLPGKLSDLLRTAVIVREEKSQPLHHAMDAITKLSTLQQSYIDAVLTNATNKTEELEMKSLVLKMRSTRANMFRAQNFVEENKMSNFDGDVVNKFKSLLSLES